MAGKLDSTGVAPLLPSAIVAGSPHGAAAPLLPLTPGPGQLSCGSLLGQSGPFSTLCSGATLLDDGLVVPSLVGAVDRSLHRSLEETSYTAPVGLEVPVRAQLGRSISLGMLPSSLVRGAADDCCFHDVPTEAPASAVRPALVEHVAILTPAMFPRLARHVASGLHGADDMWRFLASEASIRAHLASEAHVTGPAPVFPCHNAPLA